MKRRLLKRLLDHPMNFRPIVQWNYMNFIIQNLLYNGNLIFDEKRYFVCGKVFRNWENKLPKWILRRRAPEHQSRSAAIFTWLGAAEVRACDDRAQAPLSGTPTFRHCALSSYALTCVLLNVWRAGDATRARRLAPPIASGLRNRRAQSNISKFGGCKRQDSLS